VPGSISGTKLWSALATPAMAERSRRNPGTFQKLVLGLLICCRGSTAVKDDGTTIGTIREGSPTSGLRKLGRPGSARLLVHPSCSALVPITSLSSTRKRICRRSGPTRLTRISGRDGHGVACAKTTFPFGLAGSLGTPAVLDGLIAADVTFGWPCVAPVTPSGRFPCCVWVEVPSQPDRESKLLPICDRRKGRGQEKKQSILFVERIQLKTLSTGGSRA
jgi:hypothetical protein